MAAPVLVPLLTPPPHHAFMHDSPISPIGSCLLIALSPQPRNRLGLKLLSSGRLGGVPSGRGRAVASSSVSNCSLPRSCCSRAQLVALCSGDKTRRRRDETRQPTTTRRGRDDDETTTRRRRDDVEDGARTAGAWAQGGGVIMDDAATMTCAWAEGEGG